MYASLLRFCAPGIWSFLRSHRLGDFLRDHQDYRAVNGREVAAREIDLTARILSMGALHKAFAATGAICTAVAAKTEGTLVHEVARRESHERADVRLGHPSGTMAVGAVVEKRGNDFFCQEAITYRTARRLMEGYLFIPGKSLINQSTPSPCYTP